MVVDSDPGALRAAIIWALDPANEPAVKRMTEKGRQAVEENYLARHYFARLWDLATEEAASRSRPRPDRAGTSARPASAGPA
jgi:hypothetical protein